MSTKRTSKFRFLPIIWRTELVTYPFYCIFRKRPKFFNYSGSMAKKVIFELQKNPLNNFIPNVTCTCMQQLRVGHQAKFWDKNKCFMHVLFPVRMVSCCIFTSCILCTWLFLKEIRIHSADACLLFMSAKNPIQVVHCITVLALLPLDEMSIARCPKHF